MYGVMCKRILDDTLIVVHNQIIIAHMMKTASNFETYDTYMEVIPCSPILIVTDLSDISFAVVALIKY